MKRTVLACFMIMSVSFAAHSADGWKKYRGNWFDIKYPASFKAQKPHCEEDRTPQSADGDRNCMAFISPDSEVEFYVFAPQWVGDPVYVKPLSSEIIQGEKISSVSPDGAGKMEWITFSAKDGSYSRSLVVSIRGEDNRIEQVFGIKFKNKAVYDRYKDRYDAFKKSLVRYGD